MNDEEQINVTMKIHEKEGSVNLMVSLDFFWFALEMRMHLHKH